MIEKIVLDYLIGRDLEGIGENVFLETPVNPPAKYIVIQKTSSGKTNQIGRCLVAVQSICKDSLYEAAVINKSVIEAMEEFADRSDEIYACRLNSDYNYTNPSSKERRYQAVFNIYY